MIQVPTASCKTIRCFLVPTKVTKDKVRSDAPSLDLWSLLRGHILCLLFAEKSCIYKKSMTCDVRPHLCKMRCAVQVAMFMCEVHFQVCEVEPKYCVFFGNDKRNED